MATQPLRCATLDVAMTRAAGIIGSDQWVSRSTLIPELRTQRILF